MKNLIRLLFRPWVHKFGDGESSGGGIWSIPLAIIGAAVIMTIVPTLITGGTMSIAEMVASLTADGYMVAAPGDDFSTHNILPDLDSHWNIGAAGNEYADAYIDDLYVDGKEFTLATPEKGDVIYYNGTSWTRLVHGNAGQVLESGGDGANVSWGNDDTGALPAGTQGDILYYNGAAWVVLGHGNSGEFLKTQGDGANPVWAADNGMLAGVEQGDVIYYNGAAWAVLTHGNLGQVLESGGDGANPAWGTDDNTPLVYAPVFVAANDATANEKLIATASGGGISANDSSDETVINAEIAANTHIILSSGHFVIDGTITGAVANVVIEGQGKDLTTITLKNGSNCDMITVGGSGWRIANLQLQGNKLNNTTSNGIYAYGHYDNITIEQVDFENVRVSGLRLGNGTHHIKVRDCKFGACETAGIEVYVGIVHDLTVEGCEFIECGSRLFEDCEDVWNELVDADVTASLDSTDYMIGNGAAKFACAAGLANGDIIATEAITSEDLHKAAGDGVGIKFWIKTSVAVASGDLQFLLDDTANCASPLVTANIPAVAANTWTLCNIDIASGTMDTCTAIISVGVKLTANDPGAFTVWLDEANARVSGDGIRIMGIETVVAGDVQSVVISDNYFYDCDYCDVSLYNFATHGVLRDVAITGNVSWNSGGFRNGGGQRVTIDGNTIFRADHAAIHVTSIASDTIISNNIVNNSKYSGIAQETNDSDTPTNTLISSNIVTNPGYITSDYAGIAILGSDNVKVIGNTIVEDRVAPFMRYGIDFETNACAGVQVISNSIDMGGNVDGSGIAIDCAISMDNAVIKNNTIINHPANISLYVTDADDMIILGNTFRGCNIPIYADVATVVRPIISDNDWYGCTLDITAYVDGCISPVVHDNIGKAGTYLAVSGQTATISLTITHSTSITDDGGASGHVHFVGTIPAGSIVQSVKIDYTEAFDSDNTTTLTLQIGYAPAGDADAFNLTASGENAHNTTTDVLWGGWDCQAEVVTAATSPYVTLTEDDDITDVISDANAKGVCTIYITYLVA